MNGIRVTKKLFSQNASSNTWCLSVLLISVLLISAQPSQCQSHEPYYPVATYQDLQAELVDNPEIIFPDLSKYDSVATFNYRVNLNIANLKTRSGYDVYAYSITNPDELCDTEFSGISIACVSIGYFYSKDNPCPPLQANETHRTIPLHYYPTVELSLESSENKSSFSDGDTFGSGRLEFDLSGCRYFLSYSFDITPDEKQNITFAKKAVYAKTEIFEIVNDILDKGGIPR